jgi:hypothetical protein
LCLKGGGALFSPTVAGQTCANKGGWGCCCHCVLLHSTAMKDSPGVVWLEENTLPIVVLGALWDFLFCISSLACLQPLDSWRDEVPLRPPTCSCSMYALFRAFLVQMTAPTPHTMGRLVAVSPDLVELLAVVTLCETSLGFIHLYPGCNMAKAHQVKYHIGLWCPR